MVIKGRGLLLASKYANKWLEPQYSVYEAFFSLVKLMELVEAVEAAVTMTKDSLRY